MSYRSTPLENEYALAEVLMRRRIGSTLPKPTDKLIPKLPNFKELQEKYLLKLVRKYKLQQSENYNKRHRASVLLDLNMGDKTRRKGKNVVVMYIMI